MASEPLFGFLAERPAAQRAAVWAHDAHEGQERDADGAPFVVHLLEVALLVHEGGYPDEVVCGALLHDVIEKGGATAADVTERCGPRVAAIVLALSEDESITDYGDRKAALRRQAEAADDQTLAVFAADKVAKARELRIGAAGNRLLARELACRREHYVACAEMLERRLPQHPFTHILRFELDLQPYVPALRWLAPARTGVPA